MPTSSTSTKRLASQASATFGKATRGAQTPEGADKPLSSKFRKKISSSNQASQSDSIRHIATSSALLRQMGADQKQTAKQVSLAGQLVVAGQLGSGAHSAPDHQSAFLSISSSSSSSLAGLSDLPAGSKTHLHQSCSSANKPTKQKQHPSPLSIRRQMNLKHVKSLIIALLAVDLLISVLVHQFSVQDQLSWSLFQSSFRLRLSSLNLILTAIWFILLIGAILFDFYYILLISCLFDTCSFLALLAFSVNHFSRRIDYNSVQLTHLLGLLFGVVFLHVYLLVVASLMIYLTLAVRRRRGEAIHRR